MPEMKEALEQKWPPEQVWLPTGVVMLAAVSPELENVEGAHWVRKDVADAAVEQAVARTWEAATKAAEEILVGNHGMFTVFNWIKDRFEVAAAAKEK